MSSLSKSSSNRLSFNCPRPLHLVHPLPESTPPSTSKSPRPNPRRQSSISYLPRDRTSDRDPTVRLNLNSPSCTSTRSNSVSVGGSPLSIPRDRRSRAFELNGPPLTLAEQHSELLHSIAQKESVCLELRSQLAMHETELIELKRKWERIVNRGFEVAGFDATSSQGSGAMLEGIREGVQGVSRFIAAGLAIGELSPPSTSTPPQPALRRTHTANQSNSSISTNTTKSTRFSQSSTSSIGEEPLILKEGKGVSSPSKEDDTVQVLIVRDTGATPTMSPNPDFVRKQQQHEQEQERPIALATCSTHSSFETEPDCFPSSSMNKRTKMHQRRSRDHSNNANLTLSLDNLRSPIDSTSTSRSTSPSVDLKREATRMKRATMNGSTFPPVSSIPGLASLAVATSPPVVSSWVGSVGKKWEELQRGSTFSKSQKRASLLISDMSQSIVSAISVSSPSPQLSSTPTSALTSTSAPSTPPTTPSYFSPFASSPATASTTSTSLLDNDDDIPVLSSVLKPDLMLKPTPMPTMQPLRPPAHSKVAAGEQCKALAEEDEEWNW